MSNRFGQHSSTAAKCGSHPQCSSATLAEVYEELGETDFDALETALRKCDADEEDIAAVHAVLDRAGRKEEVGD